MRKYLITGRQGSGKTTVIKELQKRGYVAYNTDDLPDVTKLQDRETGEVIDWPDDGIVDWSKYAWNWQRDPVMRLLGSGKLVFLGAVVSNQKEYYQYFYKVFALIVDVDTVRQRLKQHEHANHHLPDEIDRRLKNHVLRQNRFIEDGAIPISAARPVAEIVDDILKQVELA